MLELKNVSKTYKMGEVEVRAVKNVSLSIEKGEFACLVGPSGCGKTTLINILGVIDDFDDDGGDLIIDGVSMKNKTEDEKTLYRRKNVGIIFQSYNLIPVLTAYENVEFVLSLVENLSAEAKKEKVYNALKLVDLEGKEHKYPNQLSGGEQQRVSIARALVKNPSIVLADEPTANLDSARSKEILETMRRLNEEEKVTFLFSTHDRLVMQYAKRLIYLKDGSLVDKNENPLNAA